LNRFDFPLVSQHRKDFPLSPSQPKGTIAQSKVNWAKVAKRIALVGGAVFAGYLVYLLNHQEGKTTNTAPSSSNGNTGSSSRFRKVNAICPATQYQQDFVTNGYGFERNVTDTHGIMLYPNNFSSCLGILKNMTKPEGFEESLVSPEMSNLQILEKQASQGDPDANFAVGVHYMLGECVEENVIKAREYFEKAAKSGHQEAILRLADMYRDGLGGLEKDPKKALKYYKSIFFSDVLDAHFLAFNKKIEKLDFPKLSGEYVSKLGEKKTLSYLQFEAVFKFVCVCIQEQKWRAAYSFAGIGHVMGFKRIGTFRTRRGGLQETWFSGEVKAAEPFIQAASQEFSPNFWKARKYLKGEGVIKNTQKGIENLKRSLEGIVPNPAAYLELGNIYKEGIEGVSQNLPEALKYYQQVDETIASRAQYFKHGVTNTWFHGIQLYYETHIREASEKIREIEASATYSKPQADWKIGELFSGFLNTVWKIGEFISGFRQNPTAEFWRICGSRWVRQTESSEVDDLYGL